MNELNKKQCFKIALSENIPESLEEDEIVMIKKYKKIIDRALKIKERGPEPIKNLKLSDFSKINSCVTLIHKYPFYEIKNQNFELILEKKDCPFCGKAIESSLFVQHVRKELDL